MTDTYALQLLLFYFFSCTSQISNWPNFAFSVILQGEDPRTMDGFHMHHQTEKNLGNIPTESGSHPPNYSGADNEKLRVAFWK